MSEQPQHDPNQRMNEGLRPFSELLSQENIVYHGVGADIVVISGIAQGGLMSAVAQQETSGVVNTNSPIELVKNGDSLVSVARAPQPGSPNLAFMTYINHNPIAFAIDSSKATFSQPANRGFYDEAFIERARDEDIIGVVVDAETAHRPIAEQPIVTGNISADVVASKARSYLELLTKLDPTSGESRDELEQLLGGIAHIDTNYLRATWGKHQIPILKRLRLLIAGCVLSSPPL